MPSYIQVHSTLNQQFQLQIYGCDKQLTKLVRLRCHEMMLEADLLILQKCPRLPLHKMRN